MSLKLILAFLLFFSLFLMTIDQMFFFPQILATGSLFQLNVRIFCFGFGVSICGKLVGMAGRPPGGGGGPDPGGGGGGGGPPPGGGGGGGGPPPGGGGGGGGGGAPPGPGGGGGGGGGGGALPPGPGGGGGGGGGGAGVGEASELSTDCLRSPPSTDLSLWRLLC